MSFYSSLAATALRLLQDKGQSVSLSRETGGTFDPILGSTSGATTTAWTGYGAAFDYKSAQVDGVMVIKGDIRLLLEAVDTTPEMGDRATVDSIDYQVISVKETSPGGVVVMYELQLRR